MKNKRKPMRPERARVEADETGLEVTITSLTSAQENRFITYEDTLMRVDGRGYQVVCIDPETEQRVHLYDFPIHILKLLDQAMLDLRNKSNGDGTLTFTIKDGGFFSARIQPAGQEAQELDIPE